MSSSLPSDQDSARGKGLRAPQPMLSLRALRILFVAMFLSVVLYAAIGTFIPMDIPRSLDSLQLIYKVISFAGGLCVAGLLLIRNLMNKDPVSAGLETGAETADQAATLPRRIRRNRTLSFIAFVISEMIALLGLGFVFLGGPRRTLYIFCAISLACLILFFPKETN
ncbi:MAG: hypothetical protein LAO31_12750 [Acidobacteriia bacterium]|nr:hypothetical protein [Terriglobia bacterium]